MDGRISRPLHKMQLKRFYTCLDPHALPHPCKFSEPSEACPVCVARVPSEGCCACLAMKSLIVEDLYKISVGSKREGTVVCEERGR